jgi:mono/diheme cytochrome c family protein
MRGVSVVIIAFAFALTSLAVSIGAQDTGGNPKAAAVKNPVPANPASIKKGQQNYNKACQHCHGDNAKGDGPLAPKNPSPANLTDDKWDHGSSDGEIYFIIANGIKDSEMKGVRSEMTATDMWHIVNYLRSIGPKPPAR